MNKLLLLIVIIQVFDLLDYKSGIGKWLNDYAIILPIFFDREKKSRTPTNTRIQVEAVQ